MYVAATLPVVLFPNLEWLSKRIVKSKVELSVGFVSIEENAEIVVTSFFLSSISATSLTPPNPRITFPKLGPNSAW